MDPRHWELFETAIGNLIAVAGFERLAPHEYGVRTDFLFVDRDHSLTAVETKVSPSRMWLRHAREKFQTVGERAATFVLVTPEAPDERDHDYFASVFASA